MHQTNCLNCEILVKQNQKFCPNCGQKTNINRLNFHEFSHDAIHQITHADKSILKLFKGLAVKPGIIAKEYLAGKRKKYFNPLNFYLIVIGIVVFMTSLFYRENNTRSKQMELAAQGIQDPVKKQELLDKSDRMKKINIITYKYSNVINMVGIPFLTLLFWVFYRKNYYYIECLLANMYFVGFIMLVYSLLIVPLQHFFPNLSMYFLAVFFAFEIIYRGFAYYQFINEKSTKGIVKAFTISFLTTAIWVLITYNLIAIYITTGFK